jgi:hypothetical protein
LSDGPSANNNHTKIKKPIPTAVIAIHVPSLSIPHQWAVEKDSNASTYPYRLNHLNQVFALDMAQIAKKSVGGAAAEASASACRRE